MKYLILLSLVGCVSGKYTPPDAAMVRCTPLGDGQISCYDPRQKNNPDWDCGNGRFGCKTYEPIETLGMVCLPPEAFEEAYKFCSDKIKELVRCRNGR